MDICTKIVHTLKDIEFNNVKIPIKKHVYTGELKTYITCSKYAETSGMDGDDEELATIEYATINLYTECEGYSTFVKDMRGRLKKAGFTIVSRLAEIFESDTKSYHIVTDVAIIMEE